ncbi:MAG: energy-coupling factor transporter ATPase [Candidatus Borkfalkiaceae bacterium]|nr:energy-coupling factor transporter ATPase [Christensenellaceae bacterium]
MKIIEIENADFCYEGEAKKAVGGLNFSAESGEFIALVGQNGSGKSTAARLINGLLIPQSGSVTVVGLKTSDQKNLFTVRSRVGMVFQNPDNQTVATIVEDDVAFGPENLGVKREEIEKRITESLMAVDMLDFRESEAEALSGGQKQRVAIAGVLAISPKVLILDESTSMLDPKGRREIMDIVKKLNREKGVTVICVTHYMDEAASADRVVVLNGGKIVESGTPREVFSHEKELLNSGLCLPRATYIFDRLAEKGILSGEIALNGEELKNKLCELFAKI